MAAALVATMGDVALHLFEPWLLLAESLRHVPRTVRAVVAEGRLATLLSPSAFSDALFGQFWATVGPQIKLASAEKVVPLLEGRVAAGRIHHDPVAVPVGGVVVEIGAGSGMWADVFARLRADPPPPPNPEASGPRRRNQPAAAEPITAIYGVEPNPQSAAALRRRVRDVGLDDIYHVVPVGIESVADADARLAPGSVDCIVGVLCFCSIPDPEENMRRLYRLLKPGGRWYVYEHVKATRGGPLLRLYQRLLNIPWSFFVGSCRICRPTDQTLRAAGPWSDVDLAQPITEASYAVLPHVLGTLTK